MGFWLLPALGDPIAVDRPAWGPTLDLLEDRRALDPSLLDRMRTEWNTHVSGPDARRIAEVLALPARAPVAVPEARPGEGPDADPVDEAWLGRLARFAAASGGFTTVLSEEPPSRRAGGAPPPTPPQPPRLTTDGPAPTRAATGAGAVGSGAEPLWRQRTRRLLGPLAFLVFALVKFLSAIKVVLLVVLKLKFAATALSALVSVGAYALLFGWRFAALFVVLLFVHEMGHVIALRREGVPAGLPLFIPFMGAVVGMRGLPENAWIEAKVGLAGPILGSIGAAATLALGEALDSDLLRVAAYFAFFLNLFNLLPVTPLDGGRAVAALHPAFWIVGLVGLVVFAVLHPSPILLLILLFGAGDARRRWQSFRRGGPAQRAYYQVTRLQRLAVASTYLGLIGLLVLGLRLAYVTA